MTRTKEFVPKMALEKAMGLFWERGYDKTSVRDLVARVGVAHAGLYGTFGNKRQLFGAALDRYCDDVMGRLLEGLEAPDAALPEIKQHFEMLFELGRDTQFQAGCLMCNAAVELAPTDDAVAGQVREVLDRLVRAFKKALEQAKTRNEIRPGLDLDGAAELLAATQVGMAVLLRARRDWDRIERVARHALSTLH